VYAELKAGDERSAAHAPLLKHSANLAFKLMMLKKGKDVERHPVNA
jgi:hypothetical protein